MPDLDFWYSSDVDCQALVQEWQELTTLLPGLKRTGKAWEAKRRRAYTLVETDWDLVTLDGGDIAFGIHRARDKFRLVSFHSYERAGLEAILRAYCSLSRHLQCLEATLTQLCSADSGPLLIFCARHIGVLNCLKAIHANCLTNSRTLRLVNRQLYHNPARLAAVSTRYCLRSELLDDNNVLMDFYWSEPLVDPDSLDPLQQIHLPWID